MQRRAWPRSSRRRTGGPRCGIATAGSRSSRRDAPSRDAELCRQTTESHLYTPARSPRQGTRAWISAHPSRWTRSPLTLIDTTLILHCAWHGVPALPHPARQQALSSIIKHSKAKQAQHSTATKAYASFLLHQHYQQHISIP